MTKGGFERAVAELGYVPTADGWRHPLGPMARRTVVEELVTLHGADAYAEFLESMRRIIPNIVDMLAKLA